MHAFKLYTWDIIVLVVHTGLGVGIAMGIVTSSLVAIITVTIIAKYRKKGNYVLGPL